MRTLRLTGSGRRWPTLLGLVVAALVGAAGAVAYFTSDGVGNGTAVTADLHAPTGVTVPAASTGSVHVSWTASTSGPGVAVPEGYYAERFNGSGWAAACGSSPSSLVWPATSCDDPSVLNGSYTYRVTAVYRTWTARSSSSGTVVVNSDTTPPTSTIAFPAATGAYNNAGWSVGCSSSICGTAADNVGGSGVATVKVSIQGPGGTFWNGLSFTSLTETRLNASGTTSWTFAFPATNFALGGAGDGTYVVRSYATDSSSNVQTAATSTTFVVDNTAPTDALSLAPSPAPVGAYLSGPTLWYTNTVAGGFSLVDTVIDSLSGPASATFAGAPSWSHGLETISSGVGSAPTIAYTSSSYAWGIGGASPGPLSTTSTDLAGNSSSPGPQLTPVLDNTGPAGGALQANGQAATTGGTSGYSGTTAFTLGPRTDYTDAGSGLASSALTVQSLTLSGGTCGSATTPFVVPTPVGGTTQPGPIVDGRCYTYTLTGIDNVGNTASVRTTVKVDTSAPAGGAVTANGSSGTSFNSTGTVPLSKTDFADAESGIASNTITRATASLSGNSCGSFSGATPVTISGGYDSATLATGCYQYTLTGTSNAGGTATATSAVVKVDTSAPSGGAITANGSGSGSYNTTGTISLSTTGFADAQSGIASNVITRASGTLSGNVCGSLGGATVVTVSGGSDPASLATGCYQYTLTGTNNAGGAATTTSAVVKVDRSAPVLTVSTTGGAYWNGSAFYFDSAVAATFTITAGDPDTGVSSSTFATAPTSWSRALGTNAATYTRTGTLSSVIAASTATNAAGAVGTFAATSITVDTTGPSNSLLLGAANGASMSSANGTLYYRSGAAGSFTLVNTVTDAGSGPASATFPVVIASGWTHGAETVSTPVGGPFTSSTYVWTAGPGAPTATERGFTSKDNVGRTSTTTLTFTPDNAAPTGTITFPTSGSTYSPSTWAGSVTGTAADGGSGVASVKVSIKDTTAGACADASGAFTVAGCTTNFVAAAGSTSWAFAVAAANLTNGHSYAITLQTIDNVGNTSTPAATSTFTYDSVGPTVTIDQAVAQADPTSVSPINFTVVFSESVGDFTTGDVTLTGSAGATTATVTGSGTTYNVAVSGMTGMGAVIATIAAGAATDAVGNGSAASTSLDNTVTVNGLSFTTPGTYSVTVPAGAGPVTFDACGAGGAGGANSGSGVGGAGGDGGCIGGSFPVPVAGVTLTIIVGQGGTTTRSTASGYGSGGAGGNGSGGNDGGGGGGASAIQAPGGAGSKIVVAPGGGGGGSADNNPRAGGAGGPAPNGHIGTGESGGDGSDGSGGGNRGRGGSGATTSSAGAPGSPGSPGTGGSGSDGGDGGGGNAGGGGAGGGAFGGGGGSGGSGGKDSGGGGGAGSSFYGATVVGGFTYTVTPSSSGAAGNGGAAATAGGNGSVRVSW